MTTRIDYYLLDQADPQALVTYTCRLLNKAYQAGLRAYVLAESSQQAQAIDHLLWTSSDANFIPHALADSAEAADPLTRICIGHQLPTAQNYEMLVNLQNEDTPRQGNFSRVAEMVSADENHKQAARKRYAAWRKIGAEQNLHEIRLG